MTAARSKVQLLAIERSSTVDQTVDRLRSAILNGDLSSGDRLPEVDIARAIGVSRASLREATRVLSQEGLISHVPHHGASVRSLSTSEIVDLFRFREVLEVGAVDAMFDRTDRGERLVALGQVVDRLAVAAAAADYPEVYRLDSEFHEMLVDAIDSERCSREYRAARNELRVALNRVESYEGYLRSAHAEHLELHRLLSHGRRAECRTAFRRHLADGMAQVLSGSDSADRGQP